jgi:hypothetical protein
MLFNNLGLSGQNCAFSICKHQREPKKVICYNALQRTKTENSKQIYPEKELRGHSPKFHIHVSVSDLYTLTIDLPVLLQEICGPTILGIYKSLTDT